MEDGVAALSWLRRKEGAGAEILVFAHSLGCAVAAHALTKQHGELSGVSGVILMAPFNNFLDEALWKLDQTSSWVKYYLWAAVRTVTGSTLPRYLLQQPSIPDFQLSLRMTYLRKWAHMFSPWPRGRRPQTEI